MTSLWVQAPPGPSILLEPCLFLVQKMSFYSIHLGGRFIINWYVIEITGQSAGTARIQIHSLLYHQLCLTHQQCRVASLLESPGEWLFAKCVGAPAQTRITPFVVSILRLRGSCSNVWACQADQLRYWLGLNTVQICWCKIWWSVRVLCIAPVAQSVSAWYLYSSMKRINAEVVSSSLTRSKCISWTICLHISCPEK